jgi:hypothetical protein
MKKSFLVGFYFVMFMVLLYIHFPLLVDFLLAASVHFSFFCRHLGSASLSDFLCSFPPAPARSLDSRSDPRWFFTYHARTVERAGRFVFATSSDSFTCVFSSRTKPTPPTVFSPISSAGTVHFGPPFVKLRSCAPGFRSAPIFSSADSVLPSTRSFAGLV